MDVKSTGTMNFLRSVLAQMRLQPEIPSSRPDVRLPKRGSVVTVGSVNSLSGSHWLAAYTASKHAVLGLSKSAVVEVAAEGIRVNVVSRGNGDAHDGLVPQGIKRACSCV